MEIRLTETGRVAVVAIIAAMMLAIVAWAVVQPFGPLGGGSARIELARSSSTASVTYAIRRLPADGVVVIEQHTGKGSAVEVARTSEVQGRLFFRVPEVGRVLVTVTALSADGAVVYRAERTL